MEEQYPSDRLPFYKYDARLSSIRVRDAIPYFRTTLPELEDLQASVITASLTDCSVRVAIAAEDKIMDIVVKVSCLGVTPLLPDGSDNSETVWSENLGGDEPVVTVRPTISNITKYWATPHNRFGFDRALCLLKQGNVVHRTGVQPLRHLFLLCKKLVYRAADNPDICYYYTPTIDDLLSNDWAVSQ